MLIKHIVSLKKIQRRATRFIVGYNSGLSYKERLIQLNLLPLMYHLELLDVAFFVTSIKNISNRFDISKYIEISTGKTRSSNKTTIKHKFASSSKHHHFYFNRISRLWNSLPSTDLTLFHPQQLSTIWNNSSGLTSHQTLTRTALVLII